MPFIKPVAYSDPKLPFDKMDDIPLEIKKAVICCHGELTPYYSYIAEMRKIKESTKKH